MKAASSWAWHGPDGHCSSQVQTFVLQSRALTALMKDNDSEVDIDALRAWLPTPDELVFIAVHEATFAIHPFGAYHPSLLCASVYAETIPSDSF